MTDICKPIGKNLNLAEDWAALQHAKETCKASTIPPPPLPSFSERVYPFLWSSPWNSFESNTSLWLVRTQFAGRINDLMGKTWELDRILSGRILLGLLTVYHQWVFTFYSHEAAHSQQSAEGVRIPGVFSWDWDPEHLVFAFHQVDHSPNKRSNYEDELDSLNGLHQQEWNAQRLFRINTLKRHFTFDEGMAFIGNTFSDVAYHMETLQTNSPKGDVSLFLKMTYENHSSVSFGEYVSWSTVSALLSYHSWESAVASIDYVTTGDREPQRQKYFTVASFQVIPPHLSIYPYPYGLFLNVDLPIRSNAPQEPALFLELGTEVAGEPDILRLAGRWLSSQTRLGKEWYEPNLEFFGALDIQTINADVLVSPFRYKIPKDSSSGFRPAYSVQIRERAETAEQDFGFDFGGQINFGTEELQLSALLGFSYNDFIESGLKGIPGGFRGLVDAEWHY